ncbi:unnamed protein product, partial [marine sediment metagenome]
SPATTPTIANPPANAGHENEKGITNCLTWKWE